VENRAGRWTRRRVRRGSPRHRRPGPPRRRSRRRSARPRYRPRARGSACPRPGTRTA
jgi:hypothetical protein